MTHEGKESPALGLVLLFAQESLRQLRGVVFVCLNEALTASSIEKRFAGEKPIAEEIHATSAAMKGAAMLDGQPQSFPQELSGFMQQLLQVVMLAEDKHVIHVSEIAPLPVLPRKAVNGVKVEVSEELAGEVSYGKPLALLGMVGSHQILQKGQKASVLELPFEHRHKDFLVNAVKVVVYVQLQAPWMVVEKRHRPLLGKHLAFPFAAGEAVVNQRILKPFPADVDDGMMHKPFWE